MQSLPGLRAVGAALDGLDVGTCVFDAGWRVLFWNEAFLRLFPEQSGRIAVGEPFGATLDRLHGPHADAQALAGLQRYLRDEGVPPAPFAFELGGESFDVAAVGFPPEARVSVWRRRAPEADPAPRAHDADGDIVRNYRLLAEFTGDVIALVTDGLIEEVSPSVQGLLGWEAGELAGTPCRDLLVGGHATMLDAALALGMNQPFQARALRADGTDVWVEITIVRPPPGAPTIVVALRDISARKAAELQLQQASRELETLAHTDALTGAANRRSFDASLETEWRRAQRDGRPLALLLFDLDNFKQLNDRHGHPAGDEVLRRLAVQLRAHARRPGDVHARFGGEEFALILPATGADAALGIGDSVRRGLGASFDDRPELAATASVGIAVAPQDADSPAALLLHADQALYRAKALGRDRCVKWDRSLA